MRHLDRDEGGGVAWSNVSSGMFGGLEMVGGEWLDRYFGARQRAGVEVVAVE